MRDGVILPDSDIGRQLGFTSDLFDGYLWQVSNRIFILFIASCNPGKGNMSRLFDRIESQGFTVAVPIPLGRMATILTHKGFVPHIENDQMMGEVEVWQRANKSLQSDTGDKVE